MQSLKDEEEQRDKAPPSETSAGLQPKRVVVSQQEVRGQGWVEERR